MDAVTGDISWTNNGGLTNPTTVNIKGPQGIQGPEGPTGPQGSGLEILDLYATLADLQSDHPSGTAGDCYAVGSSSSNTLYIWSDSQSDWVEIGPLKVSMGSATCTYSGPNKTIDAGDTNTVTFSLPNTITSVDQVVCVKSQGFSSSLIVTSVDYYLSGGIVYATVHLYNIGSSTASIRNASSTITFVTFTN